LGDFDNDGYLDLFLTTADTYGDQAVLYRNNGNWTFANVTAALGLGSFEGRYQAAWADIDKDGDLDLVTGAKIFVNDGNDNHWLKVTLEGDGTTINKSAVGARVRIDLGGGTILTRQVAAGTGEGNANDLTLHFGLGQHDSAVDVQVTWPGGIQTIVPDVAVDQHVLITTEPVTCLQAVSWGYGLSADFNEDCRVNWTDFGIFAGKWLDCINPPDANCDRPWE
jgi:hypothetical protein